MSQWIANSYHSVREYLQQDAKFGLVVFCLLTTGFVGLAAGYCLGADKCEVVAVSASIVIVTTVSMAIFFFLVLGSKQAVGSSDKKLFQLVETRFFTVTLTMLAAYFIWRISDVEGGVTWDGSSSQLNDLAVLFKVPLAILATIPVLVSLIGINHRSALSAKTNRLSSEQNTFANYYKHREEFNKTLKALEQELDVAFFDTHGLYKTLFPKNSPHYLSIQSFSEDSRQSALEYHADEYKKWMGYITKNSDDVIWARRLFQGLPVLSKQLHFSVNTGMQPPLDVADHPEFLRISYKKKRPLIHAYKIVKVLEALSDFARIDVGPLVCPSGLGIKFEENAANVLAHNNYVPYPEKERVIVPAEIPRAPNV